MKPMNLKELAELGHLIGHSATEITTISRGTRYVVGCSCGYACTGRRTQALALEAIVHHLYGEVRRYAASGRPLPFTPVGESVGESLPIRRTAV